MGCKIETINGNQMALCEGDYTSKEGFGLERDCSNEWVIKFDGPCLYIGTEEKTKYGNNAVLYGSGIGLWCENDSYREINGTQISLLFNHAQKLNGLQAALGGNEVKGNMSGGQAALLVNIVRGNMSGGQAALGGNEVKGNMSGGQAAVGVNIVKGNMSGVQAAVVMNEVERKMSGGQVALGVNEVIIGNMSGGQVAVVFNSAARLLGIRAGLVNYPYANFPFIVDWSIKSKK